jgi:hypothetical protein
MSMAENKSWLKMGTVLAMSHACAFSAWGFPPRCGLSFKLVNNMLELS